MHATLPAPPAECPDPADRIARLESDLADLRLSYQAVIDGMTALALSTGQPMPASVTARATPRPSRRPAAAGWRLVAGGA